MRRNATYIVERRIITVVNNYRRDELENERDRLSCLFGPIKLREKLKALFLMVDFVAQY